MKQLNKPLKSNKMLAFFTYFEYHLIKYARMTLWNPSEQHMAYLMHYNLTTIRKRKAQNNDDPL